MHFKKAIYFRCTCSSWKKKCWCLWIRKKNQNQTKNHSQNQNNNPAKTNPKIRNTKPSWMCSCFLGIVIKIGKYIAGELKLEFLNSFLDIHSFSLGIELSSFYSTWPVFFVWIVKPVYILSLNEMLMMIKRCLHGSFHSACFSSQG